MFKGIKDLELFDKGYRSFIYKGIYKGKAVVIKTKKPSSKAKNMIKNEVKWLKILDKYNIGPKLIKSEKDYFICEFIEGEQFLEWIKSKTKVEVVKVIIEVFRQLRILDNLKIDKKEMHNPFKHILVNKEVKLIDFERCHKVKKPKNVTQFCQFLMKSMFKPYFNPDKNKLILLLKEYKNKQDDKTFNKILEIFS